MTNEPLAWNFLLSLRLAVIVHVNFVAAVHDCRWCSFFKQRLFARFTSFACISFSCSPLLQCYGVVLVFDRQRSTPFHNLFKTNLFHAHFSAIKCKFMHVSNTLANSASSSYTIKAATKQCNSAVVSSAQLAVEVCQFTQWVVFAILASFGFAHSCVCRPCVF